MDAVPSAARRRLSRSAPLAGRLRDLHCAPTLQRRCADADLARDNLNRRTFRRQQPGHHAVLIGLSVSGHFRVPMPPDASSYPGGNISDTSGLLAGQAEVAKLRTLTDGWALCPTLTQIRPAVIARSGKDLQECDYGQSSQAPNPCHPACPLAVRSEKVFAWDVAPPQLPFVRTVATCLVKLARNGRHGISPRPYPMRPDCRSR